MKTLLTKVMIRRTHCDTLFQSRLLTLPRPSSTTEWLDFNETERAVYETVKSRFITRINCISRADELDKNYG